MRRRSFVVLGLPFLCLALASPFVTRSSLGAATSSLGFSTREPGACALAGLEAHTPRQFSGKVYADSSCGVPVCLGVLGIGPWGVARKGGPAGSPRAHVTPARRPLAGVRSHFLVQVATYTL